MLGTSLLHLGQTVAALLILATRMGSGRAKPRRAPKSGRMQQAQLHGGGASTVASVDRPTMDDRTQDPYWDADVHSIAPSEGRQSDEFEDADEYFDDESADLVPGRSDYENSSEYTGYGSSQRERTAHASRSARTGYEPTDYTKVQTDDLYDEENDDNYHGGHGYIGRTPSFRPTVDDQAQSRGHGVYVEHPHTAFEDTPHRLYKDTERPYFNPNEMSAAQEHAGDFPALFMHSVAEYGEFGFLSRMYLEIRQMIMFGLTSLGLSILVNLAFARYLNPFRKNYPKARLDFEYERRITGERFSERVEYYAEYWGYRCEEYEITTREGWILKAHRISDPRRPGGRGYPVVLQHGILCTSLFFFTSEERSLGFWLVDQGFDVWSTNIRSNYGAGHTRYSRWDPRFWSWSLIELGDDLVDMVDFVLQTTGYRQLAFVGHSQGTGSMFLALNKYAEFGKKLSSFTALGPAVYPGSSLNRLPFKVMKMVPSRWAWSLVFGVREFLPALDLMRTLLPKSLFGHMAYIVFAYLFDFHDHNWVDRHKPKIFCSTGVTTSSELLYFWIHSFVARGCVFDPRITRPWFPVSFPPLTVAYGTIDHLVLGKPLVDRLLTYESNVQIVHILELKGYEHMDMVLGGDAYKTVFPKIKDTIVRTIDPEDVPVIQGTW